MECCVGSVAQCSAEFTDVTTGAKADPTTVTFKLIPPVGNPVTYVYGTDPELVKDSTGCYHVNVTCDHEGEWSYRFEGTGVTAASEGSWTVVLSPFV